MTGRGDLVAADDHRSGVPGGHRLSLGDSQAQSPLRRVFPGNMVLGDLRSDGLERQPEALQQHAPIGRSRGQNERVHRKSVTLRSGARKWSDETRA